jgi:type 1 glutamine amidotransferase
VSANRCLLLAGGPHPYEQSVPPLVALLREAGLDPVVEYDIEGGLQRLVAEQMPLLIAHCLRWSMTQDAKYEPLRAQHAFFLSDKGKQAIRDHAAAGRGIFGIHTGPINFDTFPEWGSILGVGWVWGKSFHPPISGVSVEVDQAAHPIARGIPSFSVVDELYCNLHAEPWMKPFMRATTAGVDGAQVAGLAGETNGARRAYCSFGHDGSSFAEPAHARLLGRAARWTAGLPLN